MTDRFIFITQRYRFGYESLDDLFDWVGNLYVVKGR